MSGTKNVLVVGANRGIGLQLVRTFVERGWTATGTVRPQTIDDPSVKELRATGARVLELDYTVEKTVVEAAQQYGHGPLDCLINCGGVGPKPFDWDADGPERILEMFNIMAVGPYLATKHFTPNLQKSPNAKVAQISSEFGCISSNTRGGFLGYRMAKAALNQQNRTIANAFKNDDGLKMIFLSLEPGYLPTRLTDWKGEDDIEESCKGMFAVIEQAKQSDSGMMFDYHGKKLDF